MAFNTALVNSASILNWIDNFGNLGTPTVALNFGGAIQYLSAGAGVQQLRNLNGGTASVSFGTPVVLDLNTLKNPDGTTCAFTDICLIGFWNRSLTLGQNIAVGGGSNPVVSIWGSGSLNLLAGDAGSGDVGSPSGGGLFIMSQIATTGWAINSSTAHTLQLTAAAGATIQVDYVIAGH